MKVGFDLGPFGHFEAEFAEDCNGLVAHLGEQMQAAPTRLASGQSYVHYPGEVRLLRGVHELLEFALDLRGDGGLDLVEDRANGFAIGGLELAHALHELGDPALLAEELSLGAADLLLVG